MTTIHLSDLIDQGYVVSWVGVLSPGEVEIKLVDPGHRTAWTSVALTRGLPPGVTYNGALLRAEADRPGMDIAPLWRQREWTETIRLAGV